MYTRSRNTKPRRCIRGSFCAPSVTTPGTALDESARRQRNRNNFHPETVPLRTNHGRDQRAGKIPVVILLCMLAAAPAAGAQVQTLPDVRTTGVARAISLDEAVRTAEAQSEAIRIARAGV